LLVESETEFDLFTFHIAYPVTAGTASDRAHRRSGYQQRDRHQAGAVIKDGEKLHCQHFGKLQIERRTQAAALYMKAQH
jgi:hypothetical protein